MVAKNIPALRNAPHSLPQKIDGQTLKTLQVYKQNSLVMSLVCGMSYLVALMATNHSFLFYHAEGLYRPLFFATMCFLAFTTLFTMSWVRTRKTLNNFKTIASSRDYFLSQASFVPQASVQTRVEGNRVVLELQEEYPLNNSIEQRWEIFKDQKTWPNTEVRVLKTQSFETHNQDVVEGVEEFKMEAQKINQANRDEALHMLEITQTVGQLVKQN